MQLRKTRIQGRDIPEGKQKIGGIQKTEKKIFFRNEDYFKRNTSESGYQRKHIKERRLEIKNANKKVKIIKNK